MAMVELYEDNAGGLWLYNLDNRMVYGDAAYSSGPFAEDAASVIAGKGEWEIFGPCTCEEDDGPEGGYVLELESDEDAPPPAGNEQSVVYGHLVATWEDGKVTIERNDYSGMALAGGSGRQYLGLDAEGYEAED